MSNTLLRITPTLLKISLGVGIAGIYCFYQYKKKLLLELQKVPENWKEIGTLEDIIFYPIKSCAGIELNEVKCEIVTMIYGRFLDRSFALIDDTGKLVTARGYPKMLKIKPKIFKNIITVTAPGMNDLEINLDKIEKNDTQKISIWGSDVLVTKCGQEYDKWFSKFILNEENGLIFVHYKFSTATKPILKELKTESFLNEDTGTLQDASSYLIINQKSIDDLNTRLKDKDKAHYKQFRPNFLIKTNGPPYDEDNWNWVKIGNETIFRTVVPSYRCIFTNINHLTAERNPDYEPLRTMKTYRVWGKSKSPRMGIQLGLRNPGIVKKGDIVYIESQ